MKNQYWAVKLGDQWRFCPKEQGQDENSATLYCWGITYNQKSFNPPKAVPLGTRKDKALKKFKEIWSEEI